MVQKLVLLLWLICNAAYAQSVRYKNKEYPSTPVWDFLVKQHLYDSSLSVQIGKNDKAGLLQLSIDTPHPDQFIGGTVYLFLEDNSIITCIDKQMRETVGNTKMSWYVLTAAEMQLLSKKRITDIRFVINGGSSAFSGKTAHFTAVNRKPYLAIANDAVEERNETATDISNLYK
jgi:hypothetical protein